MSRPEGKATAVGLDIGTSRIVAARQYPAERHYQAELNAFVAIPYSKLTEAVLRKEAILHTVEAGDILVYGNESERLAGLLNKDTRRTMTRGLLNPDEQESVRIIREMLRTLAGQSDGPLKLCFTVPAPPLGAEENLTYHEATIRQMLTGLGYEVKSINEGLAVVYGEMESSNYTGVGISCGGGLCNVCLAYLSVPIISFSMPKAGDFIDASTASITGERANLVRLQKEQSFTMNGHFEGKLQQVLSVYYDDMIQALVAALRTAFSVARNLPKLSRPIPLVLSGGTAIPKGFRDRFETVLRSNEFPIAISEIRVAPEPLNTTATGALVAALSDM